jgi:hypothetical protein
MNLGQRFFLFSVLSLPLCGDVFAERYSASDCQSGVDALWQATQNNYVGNSISKEDEWGEGTINTVNLIDPGEETWIEDIDRIENCTNACGNNEVTQPNPITQTLSVSASFNDSVSTTVEGSISSTFLTGIKAKLLAASETTHGFSSEVSHSVSVTLPPCQWQVIYAKLQVIEGKQLQVTATLQPYIKFRHGSSLLTTSGLTENFTHSVTVDMAVSASGSSGTQSNGSCPPDLPF